MAFPIAGACVCVRVLQRALIIRGLCVIVQLPIYAACDRQVVAGAHVNQIYYELCKHTVQQAMDSCLSSGICKNTDSHFQCLTSH